jgi:hypothetical protein
MPRSLKVWGVLASICVVVTILLAKAFPLSWIALWPAAFSVLSTVVYLCLALLRIIASFGKLIITGKRMLDQSRRNSHNWLDAYSPAPNEKLDGLSQEVDELRRIAEQLDWIVKASRIYCRTSYWTLESGDIGGLEM